jgi:hypothetical protein
MSERPRGTVEAPWTPGQVESLNAFQQAGTMHPFTCGSDACPAVGGRAVLTAREYGWVCLGCDYTQSWAHAWMTDWSWQVPSLSMAADIFGGVHDPAPEAG